MNDSRSAKRKLPSGTPEAAPKRKDSIAQHPSPKKLKLSEDRSALDDPVRKYCLGKLEEVIRPIFLEYAVTEDRNEEGSSSHPEQSSVAQTPKELSEDEKTQSEHDASAFVAELEKCIFQTYSEQDKNGHPSAGGKYKCVQLSLIRKQANELVQQGTLPDAYLQPGQVRPYRLTQRHRISSDQSPSSLHHVLYGSCQ